MTRVALLVLCLATAGCFVGTDGKPRVLLNVQALDGGDACPNRGRLIRTGIDANGDDVLEDSEVTSSIPMCDGAAIQSGTASADYRTDGWNLTVNSGDRYFDLPVTFATPFAAVPVVEVALKEVDSASPERVRVQAKNIKTTGFTLSFGTWANSVLNGAVATWVAYLK